MDLIQEIYTLTSRFPKQELFGIVSQIRRSVISISSNIAEGSSRPSRKDYCRFIDIAIGSLNETENLLQISARLNYISIPELNSLMDKIATIGSSLGAFRKYLTKH